MNTPHRLRKGFSCKIPRKNRNHTEDIRKLWRIRSHYWTTMRFSNSRSDAIRQAQTVARWLIRAVPSANYRNATAVRRRWPAHPSAAVEARGESHPSQKWLEQIWKGLLNASARVCDVCPLPAPKFSKTFSLTSADWTRHRRSRPAWAVAKNICHISDSRCCRAAVEIKGRDSIKWPSYRKEIICASVTECNFCMSAGSFPCWYDFDSGLTFPGPRMCRWYLSSAITTWELLPLEGETHKWKSALMETKPLN